MKELNQDTLRAALTLLPEYDPPASVWENLDAALEADILLGQDARQLPLYEPPMAVWENIAAQLPMARSNTRRIMLWPRLAAAAAIVGVLFGAWWLMRPTTNASSERIVVTQETLDTTVVAAVQEDEEAVFDLVQNLCAAKAPICNQPAFKSLKSELDELTSAKHSLQAALGQYGDDPELTNQLVQIENSRTQLLQEIMQMI